jgi:phenylalanyl-tRNA synthetase beta chain
MYLSYKWLKDFVQIPKNVQPEEIGAKLTIHTVEIDGVVSQAEKFANVVIGRILEIKKHPQADKLQIALVDVKTEKLSIVCGAPNIEVGMVVPVALVGAVLPNGLEIKPAVIRGEESQGMLCAEDELGLGDDHSGIMVLDADAKLGSAFSDYLGFDDIIFEVDNKSITNRPDLWCHYGMARELSAFLGSSFESVCDKYKINEIKMDEEKVDLRVRIADKDLCRRYLAVAMDGIRVEESPKWLQYRLISVGIRPINNIVDISNYVMMELGQPMHAFDLTKISKDAKKANIAVRNAKKGETLKCLMGMERELSPEDLLIANDNQPLAIAGIIGGQDSAIDDNTSAIVLESANFKSTTIRKTSQRLSLRTESSQRFEKSLDPVLCEAALFRAIELVRKLCPEARIVSRIVDEANFTFNEPKIKMSLDWLRRFLGAEIGNETIVSILGRLGFSPLLTGDLLEVSVPSWRATKDISIKEDIAEEIARIYGYDNIKPQMPQIPMMRREKDLSRHIERDLRTILSGAAAMSEVSNYSFVGEEQLKSLGVDFSKHIRLLNPVSQNHTMLRQSIATNLFENVRRNQARYDNIDIFEIGSVYLPMDGSLMKSDKDKEALPYEEKRLGLLCAGDSEEVFMRLKSIIAHLSASLALAEPRICPREKLFYWSEEKYSAEISIDDRIVGIINLLSPEIAKKNGIKKRVAVAEIYPAELASLVRARGSLSYQTFEKYPALIRDLAFIIDETVLYNSLKDEIRAFHEYINRVELFDEYHGESLGKNKKSLAFHIIYQAEKTLQSKEVDDIQTELIKHLEQKFEAKVRDF